MTTAGLIITALIVTAMAALVLVGPRWTARRSSPAPIASKSSPQRDLS
ncbi:hypothetical protein [Streptomyces hygroscopicus]|nr:hypothetical protein [Streptomyces hygroscopicus]